MSVRHQYQPDIAIDLVDRDHIAVELSGNASRKAAMRRCRVRLHVLAHHFLDRQVAHPADIGGAADGLAAQMETPRCERIAEHFAGHLAAMMTAMSTAVVSQRSPVVSSAMNVIVNGPPMTEADSALMPITA